MNGPNRTREARLLAGLTVGQAAKLLGWPQEGVVEVEQCRSTIRPETIRRLAELYDVNPCWLAGESPAALAPDDPRVNRLQLAKLDPGDRVKLLRTLAAILGPLRGTQTS